MKTLVRFLKVTVALALFGMVALLQAAETQRTFETPEAAFTALLDGFDKNNDEAILDVLGHENRDLVVQSDREEAQEIRRKIFNCAKESLQIVKEGERATAVLGLKNWRAAGFLILQPEKKKFSIAASVEMNFARSTFSTTTTKLNARTPQKTEPETKCPNMRRSW